MFIDKIYNVYNLNLFLVFLTPSLIHRFHVLHKDQQFFHQRNQLELLRCFEEVVDLSLDIFVFFCFDSISQDIESRDFFMGEGTVLGLAAFSFVCVWRGL